MRWAARILLAATVSSVTTRSVTAQTSSLRVHVRNDARLGDDTLEAARQLVSEIYSHAGLELIWADDKAALAIVLRPRASKQTAGRAPDAMGYTPGGGTERGRLAFVLVNRVHEVSDGYGAPRSVVLGVAIAHELGHLLLSKEHSTTGIMKPYFNQADFRGARNGRLLFTDQQARLLRNVTETESATGPSQPSTSRPTLNLELRNMTTLSPPCWPTPGRH